MFVAVTGVGGHFRSVRKRPVFRLDETYGFLRTVLYAGETVFAAADNMMLSDMQDFFQQAPYAYLKVYALLYQNGSVENLPVPTAQPCILR